ncbi:hypothetical protein EOA85_11160 [Mesorhizobium sp. M5C.F.Ca.IN.020.29.1.1]|uniref:hypothetical protein n=1 Tax=unclassified Mesorhizobium TaxID=325217 RepID=UPI000FCB02EB|nr:MULTISPECIES: hypothetical protein [unclassified Mesorhizobium]RUV59647.1 hypothetical protein EOA85_11160 [Mesorhizobium sp. M5C.F.Ca.IN.020.29.1.1]TIM87712.1 MAG: hypothetical protein E5Y50_11145 [Mesorhizobium sp.]
MSNELTVSENSGAAAATGPATDGLAGGVAQSGFASLTVDPARKAEIERIMNEDFDLYERSGLNKEYLALLEAEQFELDADSMPATRPLPADVSRNEMCSSEAGRRLVMDWERAGGFKVHLANVQKTVSKMVSAIGSNRAQRAFMERFDRDVPEGARYAIYGDIAMGDSMYVAPATGDQMAEFGKTPAGKAMLSEWGSRAAENVSVIRARAARMISQMPDDDVPEFLAWVDELPAEIVTSIYRNLTSN